MPTSVSVDFDVEHVMSKPACDPERQRHDDQGVREVEAHVVPPEKTDRLRVREDRDLAGSVKESIVVAATPALKTNVISNGPHWPSIHDRAKATT